MRAIVVNQSDELRQLLQYVFEQGVAVEVVLETNDINLLPQQVASLQPDSLFLLQEEYKRLTGVIPQVLDANPGLQIILLSTDGQHIRFRQENWNTAVDSWPEYSLSDFIYHLTIEGPPKESSDGESMLDVPPQVRAV